MKLVYAVVVLLTTLLLIGIFCCLSSCSTAYKTAKEIEKQHELNYKHPDELAADCAKWFPNVDSAGKVKPAINIDLSGKVDGLKRVIDSLAGAKPVTHKDSTDFKNKLADVKSKADNLAQKYKPCKPDTVPKYITNTAVVAAVTAKLAAANKNTTIAEQKLADTQASQKTWMEIAIGLMVVVFGTVIWKIYKLFNGGAVTSAVSAIKKI